jgi:hypothetical protein
VRSRRGRGCPPRAPRLRRGHGDADVRSEHDAQIVCCDEVGRIADRDQHGATVKPGDRQHLVAACKVLGQEFQRFRIGSPRVEVDVLELVLLGERRRDLALGHVAELYHDLAEPPAGHISLDTHGDVELLP